MGSIGSWMSPSGRMTAACGIGRLRATWRSCARSPSTSSVTAEQPRSACGRVASRPPGMMRTGRLYWPDDFMRRPCLGRSLKHLIESVTQLHSQGIGFKSLTEQIDTTTSGGKLIFHIFGALAEFERDIIRERTQAGLIAARARGKRGGRRPTLKPKEIALVRKLYEDKQTPVEDICRSFRISRM